MGMTKTLKKICVDLFELTTKVLEVDATVIQTQAKVKSLERQLTPPKPPTLSESLSKLGQSFSWGFSGGITGPMGQAVANAAEHEAKNPPPPTLYEMVKELFDRKGSVPSGLLVKIDDLMGYAKDTSTSVARLRANEHETQQSISRSLVRLHNKVKDIDHKVTTGPKPTSELSGALNNLSKIRAQQEHTHRALKSLMTVIEGFGELQRAEQRAADSRTDELFTRLDRIESQRATPESPRDNDRLTLMGRQLDLLVDRVAELRIEMHGHFDEVRAELYRQNDRMAELQPQKVYASKGTTETLQTIDERTAGLSVNLMSVYSLLEEVKELAESTQTFAYNSPTAHQFNQLYQLAEHQITSIGDNQSQIFQRLNGISEMLSDHNGTLKSISERLGVMEVSQRERAKSHDDQYQQLYSSWYGSLKDFATAPEVAALRNRVDELTQQANRTHTAVTHIREGLERANMIEP